MCVNTFIDTNERKIEAGTLVCCTADVGRRQKQHGFVYVPIGTQTANSACVVRWLYLKIKKKSLFSDDGWSTREASMNRGYTQISKGVPPNHADWTPTPGYTDKVQKEGLQAGRRVTVFTNRYGGDKVGIGRQQYESSFPPPSPVPRFKKRIRGV